MFKLYIVASHMPTLPNSHNITHEFH